jgi:Protein of unknown function (DUF3592)
VGEIIISEEGVPGLMLSPLIPNFVLLICNRPIFISPSFIFHMEGAIFFIIGAVLLYLAFRIRRKVKKIARTGIHAEGTVIDLVDVNISKDIVPQFPVIRFVTLKGEGVTEQYNISAPSLPKKGQKVDIVYNPENPKEFFINTKTTTKAPKVLIILAIVCFAVGIYKFLVPI